MEIKCKKKEAINAKISYLQNDLNIKGLNIRFCTIDNIYHLFDKNGNYLTGEYSNIINYLNGIIFAEKSRQTGE